MGNTANKNRGPESIQDLTRKHEFTTEELKEWTSIFREHSGNEKCLTESEFAEVYSMAFTGDPRQFIKHVFRSFDTNHDGVVDINEFLIGISCSTSDDTKTKLAWAFSVYDVDGNGVISKDEVFNIIHAMKCMIGEDTPTFEIQTSVEKIFKCLDKNHDERITWEEFYSGVQKDHRLIEILDCEPQHV